MHQLMCLLRDGINDFLIVITQTAFADTAGQVDVTLAFHIPQLCAIAMIQRNGKTAIGIHYILVFLLLELVICHDCFSPFINRTSYRHPDC